MAIYHFSAKIIKRSEGHSATAHAAYCAHEKIKDPRTGEIFDYSKRNARDPIYSAEIILPANAPVEFLSREKLWGEVEKIEKRKDAQVARSIVLALPVELSKEANKKLAHDFCSDVFVSQGMIADVCLHDLDSNNPHAHIILTTREVGPGGFGKKNRNWNDKELLKSWRESWSNYANHALKQNNIDQVIDHRSYEEQGLERIPTIKLGAAASALIKKGKYSERAEINKKIREANELLNERIKINGYLKLLDTALKKPDFVFSEENTPLSALAKGLGVGFNSEPFFTAVAQRNIDFNQMLKDDFNETVNARLNHTINLSIHRTARRKLRLHRKELKNVSKALDLVQESERLTERLYQSPQAQKTAEEKVFKMSVFQDVYQKLKNAGRDIWQVLTKPFSMQEKAPQAPTRSAFSRQLDSMKDRQSKEQKNNYSPFNRSR